MTCKPFVLGFDTSAAHCAAALLRGDEIVESLQQDMTRGQAEALMPLLEGLLQRHDVAWSDLTKIGVGIGPGNFTGIRISVSAARGLALGLGIPAVGVSTFQASLLGADDNAVGIVPAPRDQVYVDDRAQAPFLTQGPFDTDRPIVMPPSARILAENIAKRAAQSTEASRPAPMYIRAADAAPSRDLPPKIL